LRAAGELGERASMPSCWGWHWCPSVVAMVVGGWLRRWLGRAVFIGQEQNTQSRGGGGADREGEK